MVFDLTFMNLAKEKALRRKLYFTVFVLAVARLLAQIPVYGVNKDYLSIFFEGSSVLSFMDSLSGGAMSTLSVAGYGITSYITATIVVQLLSVVFPSIERIRKDGERGRKTLEKIQFILAMVITLLCSLTLSISSKDNGMFETFNTLSVTLAVCSWLMGTFIIVALAQKVEEYGIGNGVSLVLCCNIISRLPKNLIAYYDEFVDRRIIELKIFRILALIGVILIFYVIVVYLQRGILNTPIKQIKKDASIMNTDGKIPMSVNIANVLPVIYASTIFAIPSLLITVFQIDTDKKMEKILSIFNTENWYSPTHWYHLAGLFLYIVIIICLGFFSSHLTFSSAEVVDGMRKNGDIIPSVAPGKESVLFLEKQRKILTVINVAFLLVIAIVPDFICVRMGISNFTFLGTSLIIIISVFFDTAFRLRAASIHNDRKFALFGKEV